MDRDSLSYLGLHYILLVAIVLGGFAALEQLGLDLPFWAGLILAVVVGFGYPKLVRELDVAPTRWE